MKNKESNKESISSLTLRLVIITLCAGLILGLVYGITKEPIAAQELKKATEARQQVLNVAQDFAKIDIAGMNIDTEKFGDITEVYEGSANGQTVGYTFSIVTKGYKPNLTLTIGIDTKGKVSGVDIGAHEETPGLGANAVNPDFLGQFIKTDGPFIVVKTPTGNTGEINALTGATITSKAVTNAVNSALEFYTQYFEKGA